MFEEIAGLPIHPLAVHAAVVFVPLLALASMTYALVPKLRSRLAWVAVTLAVLAPVAATTAVLSGNAFQQRRGLPLEGALADHRDLGLTVLFATLAVAVAVLLLVWIRRGDGGRAPGWLAGGLSAVVVVAAVAALVSAVLAGDSGARMVWEQLWQLTG